MRIVNSLFASFALAVLTLGSITVSQQHFLRGGVIGDDRVRFGESMCSTIVSRSLSVDRIAACESCEVRTVLRPRCASQPLDVVLVLAGYADPFNGDNAVTRRWTEAAVEALGLESNPSIRVGVVYVRRTATVQLELTNEVGVVRRMSRVELVNPGSLPGDYPCYSCGFSLAARLLRDSDKKQSVIIYIGGMIDFPLIAIDDDSFHLDWLRGTSIAKRSAETLVVGCPHVSPCKDYSTRPWWREASPGMFFEGPGPARFADAIEGLIPDSTATRIEALQVRELVPDELTYVPGSAMPSLAPTDETSGEPRWRFASPVSETITLTYRVRPRESLSPPMTATFASGQVLITDTTGATSTIRIPAAILTITELCAPIGSPTPPPTNTPEPTPTPEPTATTPPSPTATATRIPAPVYLPITLSEVSCTRTQRADVVLVMDASTSMNEPAGDGRTKLDAARTAALLFVDRLRLDAGDQAAVVGFNHDARLLVGLTDDRPALADALARLETASETCLVCGLEAAGAALDDDARRPGNSGVVIVLTDGRSNPRPASEAVEEAARLKARGLVIFSIGLGAELDEDALVAIASRPAFAHRASDAAALEAIYREIAVTLPGPADCYWGRRP